MSPTEGPSEKKKRATHPTYCKPDLGAQTLEVYDLLKLPELPLQFHLVSQDQAINHKVRPLQPFRLFSRPGENKNLLVGLLNNTQRVYPNTEVVGQIEALGTLYHHVWVLGPSAMHRKARNRKPKEHVYGIQVYH